MVRIIATAPDWEKAGELMLDARNRGNTPLYAAIAFRLGYELPSDGSDPLLEMGYAEFAWNISQDPGSANPFGLSERDIMTLKTKCGLDDVVVDLGEQISAESVVQPQIRVRKKDLQLLSDFLVGCYFHGYHNLNIPQEIKDASTGLEIVSMYIFAGYSQKKGTFNPKDLTIVDKIFSGLVEQMNQFSFSKKTFRKMKTQIEHDVGQRYQTKPGDQQKRYSRVSEQAKTELIKSFFSPYKFSYLEDPEQGSYGDPGNRRNRFQRVWMQFNAIKNHYR